MEEDGFSVMNRAVSKMPKGKRSFAVCHSLQSHGANSMYSQDFKMTGTLRHAGETNPGCVEDIAVSHRINVLEQ